MTAAPASLAMFLPFDPAGPASRAGLYEVFREVREATPVVRGPAGLQSVLTHRGVSGALRSPAFGWGGAETVASHFGRDPEGNPVRQFIFMDPPEHTRIRSLVTKAFSARMLERLRPKAEQLVTQLIDDLKADAADGPTDLLAKVAHPLPALLLGELVGTPPEYMEQFRQWSMAIARGLDPDMMLTPEEIARRDGARAHFDEFFAELAARRRAEPGDDLVSALVRVQDEGDRLSPTDLVVTCTLLMSAGYATTAHLIGNSMLALLSNRDQLEVFRNSPDQVPAMVEELHRFDAPVQMIARTALQDTEIEGHPVAAGEPVLLVIGAANHDPAVYDNPDQLDLTRRSDRHLGFGIGIHFCVGAPLARLTAQVALRKLTELDLVMADQPPAYSQNLIMRGLTELPVTLR